MSAPSSLTRTLTALDGQQGPFIAHQSRMFIDFSSNDYLGLKFNACLQSDFKEGIDRFGIGSGGSAVVCGYDSIKQAFETAFSAFLKKPKGLFLGSGFSANLALFASIFQGQAVHFFLDKSCHASIYDGLKLRGSENTTISRYSHGDMTYLEKLLQRSSCPIKIIVSEGIFSMTGSHAPMTDLVRLKKQHQALLVLDDAHCIGVEGGQGEGSLAFCQPQDIDIVICPLGKAFAMQGAMICANDLIIQQVIQAGRPFIYSTAPSTALVYTLDKALVFIQKAHHLRAKLKQNIDYFKAQMLNTSHQFLPSDSAIQFLVLGSADKAMAYHQLLLDQQIYSYPMRYPTVSHKMSGLRLVLSAAHDTHHIDALLEALSLA